MPPTLVLQMWHTTVYSQQSKDRRALGCTDKKSAILFWEYSKDIEILSTCYGLFKKYMCTRMHFDILKQ